MFYHNFKYSLKVLLNNKMLIFWTFAFPIILSFLFNLAFSDIEKNEMLDVIDIAIINNETFKTNEVYKTVFEELSNPENDNQLFNVTITNEKEAHELLENNMVTGILKLTPEEPSIIVNQSGVNETIFRYVVDDIMGTIKLSNSIMNKKIEEGINNNIQIDYDHIYNEIDNILTQDDINIKDISNDNLSYTMIEYYTLIAMSCLYSGIISMYVINSKLANMNSVGKRSSISPINKRCMLIGSLLASYLVQIVGLLLLFLVTIFIIKVDYGNKLLPIIILSLVGSLAGLTLGVAVGTLIKSNENTKTGILISISMAGCFLSGMMGITMKYIIDKNIPILNKINPASMITDGLYSLYYYDTLDRYIFNVISLIIFSLLMILISYRELRRQAYDSI